MVNFDWSKYLYLEGYLKEAAPVYQFATENDDKALIGIFKQNLKNLNQKTSQTVTKNIMSM